MFSWLQSIPERRQVDHSKAFLKKGGGGYLYLLYNFAITILLHSISFHPYNLVCIISILDYNSHFEERKCLIHFLTVPPPASGAAMTLLHICWTPGYLSFETIWVKGITLCKKAWSGSQDLCLSSSTITYSCLTSNKSVLSLGFHLYLQETRS